MAAGAELGDGGPDWHPMLLTRAWPFRDLLDEFDAYQASRHLPELVSAPGASSATAYAHVTEDLPALLQGSGSRVANYVSTSLERLFQWLASEEFAAAVDDGGRQWFGRMNELDGDLYTGNIYRVAHVATGAADVPADAALFVERFEAGAASAEAMDRWAIETHLPALAAAPGVLRVRWCHAVRGASPLPYYDSIGDRMAIVDLDPDRRLPAILASPTLLSAVVDSLRWDPTVTYARREVYRFQHAELASAKEEQP